MRDLNIIRSKKGFISDMDGVIYQGSTLIPGVKDFVTWLQKEKKQFLFLTNSSERTPLELRKKLQSMGLDIEESHFYTSALATAHFLKTQAPGCSAYIIGNPFFFLKQIFKILGFLFGKSFYSFLFIIIEILAYKFKRF